MPVGEIAPLRDEDGKPWSRTMAGIEAGVRGAYEHRGNASDKLFRLEGCAEIGYIVAGKIYGGDGQGLRSFPDQKSWLHLI